MSTSLRRNARPMVRAARPRMESLEARWVMDGSASPSATVVGNVLMIAGTPRADLIRVLPTESVGTVRVVVNGRQLGRYGPVAEIDINGGAGGDVITVDPRITLRTRIDGQAGNDRLQGGSGANALVGGDGFDTLVGTSGRDTFDGGPGGARQVFLKTLGTLQVGPSASGAGLRRLTGAYSVQRLQVGGPAVVGAADLRNARIVGLLKGSYDAGQTISLANATQADANTLADLLGDPRPVVFSGGLAKVDLVSFRKVSQDGQQVYSIDVMAPVQGARLKPGQRAAGAKALKQGDRLHLATVFTPTPKASTVTLTDANNNLIQLAKAYQSSTLQSNQHGDNIQVVNLAYAARSFQNQLDIYYVSQEIDSFIAAPAIGQAGNPPFPPYVYAAWGNGVTNTLTGLTPSTTTPVLTLSPSPQTTETASTVTSGVSFSIGGSVGFNQAQGGIAGLSLGLTISNSTTKTVPPMTVTYSGDPATSETKWSYVIGHENLPQPSQTLSFVTGWIWEVPTGNYAQNPTALTFDSGAGLGYNNPLTTNSPTFGSLWTVSASMTSSIPLPFGTNFTLAKPQVTSVSPTTVRPGESFTIEGVGLYAPLLSAVLIGGQQVASANYTVLSDTQIQVIAPNTPGVDLSVSVQTSQGQSNTDQTITIANAPTISVTGQAVSAVAGQAFANQVVATFTSSNPSLPAGVYGATINWGDGSGTSAGTITSTGSGTFSIQGGHTYATAGSYPISITVNGPESSQGSASSTANVTAQNNTGGPQNLTSQAISATVNQAFTNLTVATFTDTDPGVSPSDFTASIDWGDGIKTPITTVNTGGSQSFIVLGTHTYVAAGNYTFTVEVTDTSNRKATTTGTATVTA
ncbi:calcium-binding protein [Aquisphaera insulae]|uniref:calcium-binding protein n=1 Tax=Aquisphaera insulae TaxID=2712864 RepID=UPI0013EA7297|nr:calcium-binding protein [Aquisphaera insulae]